MLKHLKHIAAILLWVMIIPVFYQPVHILHHHASFLPESECSSHKKQTPPGISNSNPIVSWGNVEVNEDEQSCYVCDYQFFVNKPIEVWVFQVDLKATNFTHQQYITRATQSPDWSLKPSRAPPCS